MSLDGRRLYALALLGLCVTARATADPIDDCSQQLDPTVRLACFDQAAKSRHDRQNAAVNPQRGQQPAGVRGLETPAQPPTPMPMPMPMPMPRATSVEPVRATITRMVLRSGHLYYFELDNGEVWGESESNLNFPARPHDSIVIRRGAMGGYFIQIPDRQSIRVYRVR